MSDSHRNALVIETHRIIRDAARNAVAKLGQGAETAEITYPPESGLTEPQKDSLGAMRLSGSTLDALEKVVADACAASFFSFFCLVDGVADPEVTPQEPWLGMDIVEPSTDADREMLHDAFYDSYWRFKERVGVD